MTPICAKSRPGELLIFAACASRICACSGTLIGLEIRRAREDTQGSNPCLSAWKAYAVGAVSEARENGHQWMKRHSDD